MNPVTKEYKVNLVEKKQLTISGNGDDKLWNNAIILTDFYSPWSTEKTKKIEFRALWDKENLFFNFTVFDAEIHIEKQDNSIKSIGKSDRVELFFRSNSLLSPYYCLEIDPSARIMDFKAYPDRNFDFEWNWPKNNIIVKSKLKTNAFTVEGAISISSLKALHLIKNNQMEVGIFRAKYSKTKSGDFEPTWITWINPNTTTPNFHVASSFGRLILDESKINN